MRKLISPNLSNRPAWTGSMRMVSRMSVGSPGQGWPLYERWREARPTRRRRSVIVPAPSMPNVHAWRDRGLYAAWLGHSTVLLKIDGVTILTDPILSNRAGVDLRFCKVGICRHVAPALPFDLVPQPDVILLSHAHMDHFDVWSLRKLAHPWTAVVTATNTAELMRSRRYGAIHELRWGETAQLGPLSIRAFEVNHWGARYGSDSWRGYNGYVLETTRHRVLFAGDTALTDAFQTLRSSRPFDLAIMPIGAYNPNIHRHCTPEQAWRMAGDANADRIMPVHHQTFRLGQEPFFEPIDRLYQAAGNDQHRIAISRIGQQVEIR